MKKVLWFSRHTMTPEQLLALGNVTVTKVSVDQLANVHVSMTGKVNDGEVVELPPFKELIKDFDILAVVLPVNLEEQVLRVADGRPVLRAVNRRVLIPNPEGGEDKVVFQFDGWKEIKEIKVILEDFIAAE